MKSAEDILNYYYTFIKLNEMNPALCKPCDTVLIFYGLSQALSNCKTETDAVDVADKIYKDFDENEYRKMLNGDYNTVGVLPVFSYIKLEKENSQPA